MKIGDIVQVSKGPCTMYGMVVKVYEDGRIFVRSIYDDFDPKSKDGWSRYGIRKDEGLFITPDRLKRDTTIKKMLKAPVVREVWKVHSDKQIEVHRMSDMLNEEIGFNKSFRSEDSCTYVYKYNDTTTQLTYVYIPSKNVGGWARGVDDNSAKVAGTRALLKWYETQLDNFGGKYL